MHRQLFAQHGGDVADERACGVDDALGSQLARLPGAVMDFTSPRTNRPPAARIASSMRLPICCVSIEPARRMWMTLATSSA
jgi:hypothetical protein